ncbi:histidine phosphatase superfamily [Emericellopsis atlantica]|uniref:Histidine phosphatase superfamily n=1 Tax=Emericellopsis atlantica TaxID=2614577 RepID=A0A9P7ZM96_9HYPO|nr:histidine phosphatase superfamily [Emericellopsis atlantica]KAG9254302.1 histidine phosphatase superfamily [Emericellopsis atlantica]
MGFKSALLLSAAASAAAEKVHGVVVFSRHGDRTTKWYGSQQLTSLGAEQNFQVGGDYRARYLESDSEHQIVGISEDEYVPSQVFASAPDQGILMNTATAFLQGLYPPLSDIAPALATQTLNNGTNSTSPLDGYQYVLLQGVDDSSPNTIWIKGDDDCPGYAESSKAFQKSDVFMQRDYETRNFYEGFYDILADDVYNIEPEDLTYANAYSIFDLINVARIHNESSAALNVSDEDFLRLRTLADSAELGKNWNQSEPDRSIGAETLSGAILAKLNETVTSEGKLKFSLLAGSYDTFLAFFGLSGLLDVSKDFYGLPGYASTMAFELYADGDSEDFPAEDDLRVRFLFKNGTAGELQTFPLFGTGDDTLSYATFVDKMNDQAITGVSTWCDRCQSATDFCAAYDNESTNSQGDKDSGKGGMSNAVAGVIGAMVTLGVVAVVGGVAFVLMKNKKQRSVAAAAEKSSIHSGSVDVKA